MRFLKLNILIACFFTICSQGYAQSLIEHAPAGFDSLRTKIARGKLDSMVYESKTVGSSRKVFIYTPPGYSKSQKYPVLYLLHGIGGDESEWLKKGHAAVILDNLYADKKVVPMIVVFPNGRAMKNDRAMGNLMDTAKIKAFAKFEYDLLNDLIPFIEKKFPVQADSLNRALAGLSMGGGQAFNFGLTHLDKFLWVGGFSAAPNTKSPEQILPKPGDAKKVMKLCWISCGDNDNLIYSSRQIHDYFKRNNVPHIYYVEPGAHDFNVWNNDLYLFTQLLFKPVDKSLFAK